MSGHVSISYPDSYSTSTSTTTGAGSSTATTSSSSSNTNGLPKKAVTVAEQLAMLTSAKKGKKGRSGTYAYADLDSLDFTALAATSTTSATTTTTAIGDGIAIKNDMERNGDDAITPFDTPINSVTSQQQQQQQQQVFGANTLTRTSTSTSTTAYPLTRNGGGAGGEREYKDYSGGGGGVLPYDDAEMRRAVTGHHPPHLPSSLSNIQYLYSHLQSILPIPLTLSFKYSNLSLTPLSYYPLSPICSSGVLDRCPMNPSQLAALAEAVTRPISLIQGPPGTGKTRTACAILATIVALKEQRMCAGGEISKGQRLIEQQTLIPFQSISNHPLPSPLQIYAHTYPYIT